MFSPLYTKLIANILFPLHEWLKKHNTVHIKRQLEQSQWASQAEITRNADQRLAKFLAKAATDVPYYRNLYKRLGLATNAISAKSALAELPLLDKSVIREHFEQLTSANAGPTQPFTTGGSSGTPLTFLLSNERVSHDVAEKWRATRWWDVDIGDKEIVAWGSPIELGAQDKVRIARDKLFRSTLIPAFDMDEIKLLGFIDQIKRIKPKMLFGYPSVYALIAKTAQKHGISLDNVGIKVVFVTSERLYPYQQAQIEQVFNAPVANGYGGRDAGFIAHACPHGKMHISAEDIIVEIIDSEGSVLPDGETGEIVVTHMATSDFPFIRYRTGDVGAIDTEPCSCGRGLPVLKNIEGRTTDFVIAQDGTMMHGLALIYILREMQGVEAFKIIQESLMHTRVLLVPKESVTPAMSEQIIDGFKQRLGAEVTIELQIVNSIAAEKSGKFRYVISNVGHIN
ncbi:phenylacetate--CoA ligase family protein [Thalassotalea euphylliae]|uniref:Phenylacetate--CoA ligase family protein n=1 Tax=Thalassotalea euphylliae TaxID=1655234 RepID=A0A3E0TL95_9GAMM|nr:AMP-binding protein [Thalassotalea euphylliae]REL25203.1 phenylacetate--CoA ligase family protein [Thalassotalea euphylliae]